VHGVWGVAADLVDDAFYRSLVMSAGAFDYYFTSSASSPSRSRWMRTVACGRAERDHPPLGPRIRFQNRVEAALLAVRADYCV
jgi:hypothetical protein